MVKLVGEELPIWDPRKALPCGFLYKKAGKGKLMTMGGVSLRFFVINIKVSSLGNFSLDHYEAFGDPAPKRRYPLAGAVLTNTSEVRFELALANGSRLDLRSETEDSAVRWVMSLTKAIAVANDRQALLVAMQGNALENMASKGGQGSPSKASSTENSGVKTIGLDDLKDPAMQAMLLGGEEEARGYDQPVQPLAQIGPSAFMMKQMDRGPMLRLDIDIHDMPPTSTQRHQFEQMFKDDIVRALEVNTEQFVVEVLSVGPTPGKDWLTMVEFDLYVVVYNEDDDEDDHQKSLAREQERLDFLNRLLVLLREPGSALYRGFITCKLDPTWAKNFPDTDGMGLELFSSDPAIERIMNRYREVPIPEASLDFSFFSIMVSFEGALKQLSIPNPRIFDPKLCMLWPYEIKAALGILGTMQDLWMEPVALVPRGLPDDMTFPITFEPCAMLGVDPYTSESFLAISAHRLKAGLTYEVRVEDFREDVINTLTRKEKEQIKKVFDEFDVDHSGDLSRDEAEELVRQRVSQRKEDIDSSFANYIANAATKEDAKRADELRLMYHQSLQESQNKLVRLYESADINGDGVISFTEFLLAEAWWLRCSLDPVKHLDFEN